MRNGDKLERTLLLEPGNKTLHIFIAFIFFINGIIYVIGEQSEGYRLLLGIAMIIFSICSAFYAVLAFSEDSKYSPKMRVNDKLIELKSSFWKRTDFVNWSDVKLIHFASYKVEFELYHGTKAFPYNTKGLKSKRLKRLLREFAEPRNIQIIGG
ncbi:MAG: hypothetical protein AAF620_09170 [Bacteroidota bacterium]